MGKQAGEPSQIRRMLGSTVQRLPNNSVDSVHNNHQITGWTWNYSHSGFWFHTGLLVQIQHYTYVGSIYFPHSAQKLENPFTNAVGKWFCRISLRYLWPYSLSPCPGHARSALALCSITWWLSATLPRAARNGNEWRGVWAWFAYSTSGASEWHYIDWLKIQTVQKWLLPGTYGQIHMALHLSLEAQLTEIGSALN